MRAKLLAILTFCLLAAYAGQNFNEYNVLNLQTGITTAQQAGFSPTLAEQAGLQPCEGTVKYKL